MRKTLFCTSQLRLAERSASVVLATVLCFCSAGCTSLLSSVSGVPAHRLPPQFLAKPKNNLIDIDISRLRQQPPRTYLVDADDVLGIYVEGVLGKAEEPPPVTVPREGSDLPPSIGFPIPIREDGTLALPLIDPMKVKGLTVTQIENLIRHEYTIKNKILQPGKDRIIVTIMKKRTYRIVVMRQDVGRTRQTTGPGTVDQVTRGFTLDLPAYNNDVMHALAETGGLPAQDAKNEILIMRSSLVDASRRDEYIRRWFSAELPDPCLCRPPLPGDPAIVKIPLRLPPGQTPQFKPEEIILEDGDIVFIEGREREVFYTGGLLTGGEYALPRDYDLDVIGAMALVGQGVGNPQIQGSGGTQGLGGFNVASIGGAPPTNLHILRRTPCSGQIVIQVDLNRAISDPNARPLVQAGDVLILQYKPIEEALNFGLGTFFTFGISRLLQGRR